MASTVLRRADEIVTPASRPGLPGGGDGGRRHPPYGGRRTPGQGDAGGRGCRDNGCVSRETSAAWRAAVTAGRRVLVAGEWPPVAGAVLGVLAVTEAILRSGDSRFLGNAGLLARGGRRAGGDRGAPPQR